MVEHFLKQKMNLEKENEFPSVVAFHLAEDERQGIRSQSIHHYLMQVLSYEAQVKTLQSAIPLH
ncbi:hypothetical protein T10_7781, partial [Trichinella papuae]